MSRLYENIEGERKAIILCAQNFLINCLPDIWIINRFVRPALARMCGMKCGSGVKLRKDIFYGNPKNVQIGDKSSINRGAFLDCYDKIIIGNNVGIAFQATLITSTHEIGGEKNRAGELVGKPIVIEDGVWVGARAIIGPGVKIGSGSLISAGAALMRSVPANSVVAGVPGRLITRLASKPATDVAAVSEGTIQGVDRSKGCLRWTPSLGQPASRVKL